MFSKGKGSKTSTTNTKLAGEKVSGNNNNGNGGKRGLKLAPSIISQDLTVHGGMTAGGDIQVDGTVDGDISSISLTVGDNATVHGEILCDEVVIRGRVIGTVRAIKVHLASTAHVEGDILHNALAVEAGAFFEGNCRHSDDPLNENIEPVNALPVTPELTHQPVAALEDDFEDEDDDPSEPDEEPPVVTSEPEPKKPTRNIATDIFGRDDDDASPKMSGSKSRSGRKPRKSAWQSRASRDSKPKSAAVARAVTVAGLADDEKPFPLSADKLSRQEANGSSASVKAALKRLTGVNDEVAKAKAELDKDGH